MGKATHMERPKLSAIPSATDQSDESSRPYYALRERLEQNDKICSAAWDLLRLTSHFQPIISLTHSRVVGHEALLRASDETGANLPPIIPLTRAQAEGRLVELDRLARVLHAANYRDASDAWLFLNMHPEVFYRSRFPKSGFMAALMQGEGLDPHNLVIEVLEDAIRDLDEFRDRVAHLREMGCLFALDDFGAGHSNFDRVWKLAPEIVKLDRSFALQIENDARVRRLFPRIVKLLHETGAFVLLEGIETEAQALIALDANIDFVQGFYFARPAPRPLPLHFPIAAAEQLWSHYEGQLGAHNRQDRGRLAPFRAALSSGAMMRAAGMPLAQACADFLRLDGAEACYTLDENGHQVGANVWSEKSTKSGQSRFRPIAGIDGARWGRRPYFRRAVENPGQIQVTRPYLSAASGHMCVTLSLTLTEGERLLVLCGDVAWK